jgi:cyclic dehypoxanthinyl futalosine synthase
LQNNLNYITSKSEIGYILNNVLKGDRLNLHDCKELIKSDDLYTIGLVASTLRKILFGNTATFINNIILNYTNVCVTYCKFCAFYRPPGHEE